MTKTAIIKAFGTAATRYDGAAGLQRQVAQDLANRIAALPLASNPKILEIGCGTGFLGRALAPLLGEAQWVCTDIAAAMVAQARTALPARQSGEAISHPSPLMGEGLGGGDAPAKLSIRADSGNAAASPPPRSSPIKGEEAPNHKKLSLHPIALAMPAATRFAVMDGEAPCFAPGAGFDLICGNLAMQWFRNPARSLPGLAALLRPGGYLVFSTLGDQSFREWRRAMQAHDLFPGTTAYPSAKAWHDFLPSGGSSSIAETLIAVPHETALGFLKELKQIGAGTPDPGYGQLGAGRLRRVLHGIAEPFTATYHLVFATYRAPS